MTEVENEGLHAIDEQGERSDAKVSGFEEQWCGIFIWLSPVVILIHPNLTAGSFR